MLFYLYNSLSSPLPLPHHSKTLLFNLSFLYSHARNYCTCTVCGGGGRHFAGIKTTMVESIVSLLWFTMMPCFLVVHHLVHYQLFCLSCMSSFYQSQAVSLFSCLLIGLSQSSLSSGADLTWQTYSSAAALLSSRPRETYLKLSFHSSHPPGGDHLFCHFPQGILHAPLFPTDYSDLSKSPLNFRQVTMVISPRTIVANPAWFRAGLTNPKTYGARQVMFRNGSERSNKP